MIAVYVYIIACSLSPNRRVDQSETSHKHCTGLVPTPS